MSEEKKNYCVDCTRFEYTCEVCGVGWCDAMGKECSPHYDACSDFYAVDDLPVAVEETA